MLLAVRRCITSFNLQQPSLRSFIILDQSEFVYKTFTTVLQTNSKPCRLVIERKVQVNGELVVWGGHSYLLRIKNYMELQNTSHLLQLKLSFQSRWMHIKQRKKVPLGGLSTLLNPYFYISTTNEYLKRTPRSL